MITSPVNININVHLEHRRDEHKISSCTLLFFISDALVEGELISNFNDQLRYLETLVKGGYRIASITGVPGGGNDA